MKKILIYGSRILSQMLQSDARNHLDFDICAFVRDKEYMEEKDFYLGLPLVSFDSVEKTYPPSEYNMIVLNATFNRMRYRDDMYNRAIAKGYHLVNYISPSAVVSPGIIMGHNNVVMEMAYLGADGIIGNSNIIRQMVYIGHDFEVGDKNVFTPNVTIGGVSKIGNNCYIGIGSTILNSKQIGDEVLIGGGAVVIKNIEDYSKNVGNPSRCIGYHREEGLEVHF